MGGLQIVNLTSFISGTHLKIMNNMVYPKQCTPTTLPGSIRLQVYVSPMEVSCAASRTQNAYTTV